MDLFSAQFLSALVAIIIIDLVLAGDNAIVIALAARNVPKHMRKRAIIWGAMGAVAVRSSLTMAVVWLLQIPGLLFFGGAVLVWIAYKLLLPEAASDGTAKVTDAPNFWSAIRTIVVADVMMGLDNVLAVAGAAHGSFLLVVLGLLVSIPIVVWGSTLIVKVIDRYPALVYLGSGVLAWTAAKMMTSEPLLKSFYTDYKMAVPALFTAIVLGVLWGGFIQNHRRWVYNIGVKLAHQTKAAFINAYSDHGGNAMLKVLVPVDGSPNSLYAIQHVVKGYLKDTQTEIHLLNVRPPFSEHIARFVSKANRREFHKDQGQKTLQPIKSLLVKYGIPHSVHVEIGEKAKLIADAAQRLGCDHIVMSTARKNSFTRMLEDSTTNKVLELTSVPVEIIAGDSVSKLERWGIPAGIGALLALFLLASAD